MELQSFYSAILRRGRRSVPTFSEVSRDARRMFADRVRIVY